MLTPRQTPLADHINGSVKRRGIKFEHKLSAESVRVEQLIGNLVHKPESRSRTGLTEFTAKDQPRSPDGARHSQGDFAPPIITKVQRVDLLGLPAPAVEIGLLGDPVRALLNWQRNRQCRTIFSSDYTETRTHLWPDTDVFPQNDATRQQRLHVRLICSPLRG